jgi:NAD(P)-dependent dehydrogenase (short-subunit alcohol dehydrogenase family)
MSKVWFVTGSASGLGRDIAEAVLTSGDRLVATVRDPRRLDDLVEKYGNQVRTASWDRLDPTPTYDVTGCGCASAAERTRKNEPR